MPDAGHGARHLSRLLVQPLCVLTPAAGRSAELVHARMPTIGAMAPRGPRVLPALSRWGGCDTHPAARLALRSHSVPRHTAPRPPPAWPTKLDSVTPMALDTARRSDAAKLAHRKAWGSAWPLLQPLRGGSWPFRALNAERDAPGGARSGRKPVARFDVGCFEAQRRNLSGAL